MDLKGLSSRRWMQCLRHRYKLLINRLLSYQPSIIPQPRSNIQTCSTLRDPLLKTTAVAFQNSFFFKYEWNKLNTTFLGSTLSLSFENTILKEMRPNSIFRIHNWLGLTILTKLRMSFSHIRKHISKHNFWDAHDPFCNCWLDIEMKLIII